MNNTTFFGFVFFFVFLFRIVRLLEEAVYETSDKSDGTRFLKHSASLLCHGFKIAGEAHISSEKGWRKGFMKRSDYNVFTESALQNIACKGNRGIQLRNSENNIFDDQPKKKTWLFTIDWWR